MFGTGIYIFGSPRQHQINQAGKFVCRGGDGFGPVHARAETAVVSAEGGVALAQGLRGNS